MANKAKYFKKQNKNEVICTLCPHSCQIPSGERGICGVRENRRGNLYTVNYGKVSSISVDPIEKKPLYHFYPGSNILSLGTYGCNFSCSFCQNWHISQEEPHLSSVTPQEVVEIVLEKELDSIAYTYSEPLVWYEFVKETSKIAADHNIENVLVSNGFINPEPLQELLPYIDAANIDIKSYNNDFYKQYTDGGLKPVLKAVEVMNEEIHLEVTTLVISGLNDDLGQLSDLFSWLKDLDQNIPLHLSRYFPNYKMERPATKIKKMDEVYHLAKKYLNYVYLGNVTMRERTNTHCPSCGGNIIKRSNYSVKNKLRDDQCPFCGERISGRFQD
jgi:pyruvate formate lyase activating enzyme